MNPNFETFKKQITNPFKFRLFALSKLPSAWFAGLKIVALSQQEAVVSVHYKWFNKNPFKSIYVGILSMPAEVSTGILGMAALYKREPSVSMLVVSCKGSFFKKAMGKILFTCTQGEGINNAVEQAIVTKEAVTVDCFSEGTNENGEVVASFYFTWSFKARR